jgi:hypothetical protein
MASAKADRANKLGVEIAYLQGHIKAAKSMRLGEYTFIVLKEHLSFVQLHGLSNASLVKKLNTLLCNWM